METNGSNDKKTRTRLAWMCGALALIDLILLLLLIFLPYNCRRRALHDNTRGVIVNQSDTVVIHDTIYVEHPDSVADDIDQAVEDAGGNVEGFMRFSITWNHSGRDRVDLDAHAVEPTGSEIYYNRHKAPHATTLGGMLDVDRIRPSRLGVENIYWMTADKLQDGDYRFFIVNYDGGRNNRCDVKLKVGNQTFLYQLSNIRQGAPAKVATVTISNHQLASIQHHAPIIQQ